jgi:hypothetical protein
MTNTPTPATAKTQQVTNQNRRRMSRAEWWAWWAGWYAVGFTVLAALAGLVTWYWGNRAAVEHDERTQRMEQTISLSNERAARLELEASSARLELEKIKEKTKDRELDNDTRANLVDWLTGGAKGTIRMWAPNSPEPVQYARQLRAAVEEAGWKVTALTVAPQAGLTTGLKIWFDEADAPAAALLLLNALNSAGLPAQLVRTANASGGEIVLAVGFK